MRVCMCMYLFIHFFIYSIVYLNVCMAGDSGYYWAVLSPGVLCERIGHPMGILWHFYAHGSLRACGECMYVCMYACMYEIVVFVPLSVAFFCLFSVCVYCMYGCEPTTVLRVPGRLFPVLHGPYIQSRNPAHSQWQRRRCQHFPPGNTICIRTSLLNPEIDEKMFSPIPLFVSLRTTWSLCIAQRFDGSGR